MSKECEIICCNKKKCGEPFFRMYTFANGEMMPLCRYHFLFFQRQKEREFEK